MEQLHSDKAFSWHEADLGSIRFIPYGFLNNF